MAATRDHPELIDMLTEGISKLASSAEWRRYLDLQSRFHAYSYGNVLLISNQCPGATQVAGFRAWKQLGRHVRSGEKAIWILAPMLRRSDDGVEGEERRVVSGFKFVPVFDLSQTEGEELPSVCTTLTGDDRGGHYDLLVKVANLIGFAVEDHAFAGSTKGDCSHGGRLIRIERRVSAAQRVKTLVHEIAHAKLHESCQNRMLAELEAESVAYVVCHAVGIDSGRYSFGYVASWAGGAEPAIMAIRSSCVRIQKTAAFILDALGEESQSAAA